MSSQDLPPEGSRVRLVGLKNPALNRKTAIITSYSRDGERVMVTVDDGPQSLVKVKPKQIELLKSSSLHGSSNNLRSSSRDHNDSMNFNHSNGRNARGRMQREVSDSHLSHGSRSNQGSVVSKGREMMDTLRSADAMFDLADTSGDGVIDFDEFEYYMKKHTNHNPQMIRDAFFLIDVDGNGDVTRDEVRNAFLKKRREMKGEGGETESAKRMESDLLEVSRDADRLFEKADVDGGGTISIREFELYMKRHTSHSDAVIRQMFQDMDQDGDGYITKSEVREAYLKKKKDSGGQKSLQDMLGLDDEDVAPIEDDVYNMFFLSLWSGQAFYFALLVFFLKLGLIIIIAIDLFKNKTFPGRPDPLILVAQFLLLPVNVSVQEELITTFYIYANLKYSELVLEISPGATRAKFHLANTMRFLDGLGFLFINTTLLFQADDVLSAFLNFAALQFLSSIDNVGLHLARDGYLTERLERVANDVSLIQMPKNHNDTLQKMDSAGLVIVYLVEFIAWTIVVVADVGGFGDSEV